MSSLIYCRQENPAQGRPYPGECVGAVREPPLQSAIRPLPPRFEYEYTWGRMPHMTCPTRRGLRTAALWSGIVLVVFLLALPMFTLDQDRRQRSNQVQAYTAVKDLSAALRIFKQQRGGYPRQLEPVHDAFVDTFIAKNADADRDWAQRSWRYFEDHELGYTYEYIPSQEMVGSNNSLSAHYEIRADPVEPGKTGFRSFYVSDTSTVRWTSKRSAGPNDPEVEKSPHHK